MLKAKIVITSQFTDETARKVEISPLAPSKIDAEEIRQKLQEINAKIADPTDTTYNTFCQSWVSDDGANFEKFSAFEIEVENKREISFNI